LSSGDTDGPVSSIGIGNKFAQLTISSPHHGDILVVQVFRSKSDACLPVVHNGQIGTRDDTWQYSLFSNSLKLVEVFNSVILGFDASPIGNT